MQYSTNFTKFLLLRWLYWSDWADTAKIEKASMDGENRTVIHDTDLEMPNGLTLDLAQQILYWIDARLDQIESSNVDGTNRRVILSVRMNNPFGLSLHRGILYYTDNEVKTVPSNGGIVTTIFERFCTDTTGIEVVSTERQPMGMYIHVYIYITILKLHLSVRESGRSREAIGPVLTNFSFSGSLELDATPKSPLTQPAMAPAPD